MTPDPHEINAIGYSDAARRCMDSVNLLVATGAYGKWCAIRMSDGGTDGHAYDSKADAVRHQLHETQCCYLVIPLVPMHIREAQEYLNIHRQLYDKGFRLSDPAAPAAMTPIRTENYGARRIRRKPAH